MFWKSRNVIKEDEWVYLQLDSVLMKTSLRLKQNDTRNLRDKKLSSSTQDIIQNVGSEKLSKGGKSIL